VLVSDIAKGIFGMCCVCLHKNEEIANPPVKEKSKSGIFGRKKKANLPLALKETKTPVCDKGCFFCCIMCVGVVVVLPGVLCFNANSFEDAAGSCAFVEFVGFFSRFGHYFSPK